MTRVLKTQPQEYQFFRKVAFLKFGVSWIRTFTKAKESKEIEMASSIVTPIQTRMSDYDVLGHINNVSYVNFLEVARLHAFSEVMCVDLRTHSGITAKTEIEYLRPAKFGIPIAVVMKVDAVTEKSVTVAMEVVNAKDHSRVFARASIVQVSFDLRTGKTCAHPGQLREQLEALMNGVADFVKVA